MFIDDTIAAISTPVGEGGIGIIRISGDEALEILCKIFKSVKGKSVKDIKSYTMMYGHIINEENEILDEVIVSYMKSPNTYTREDVVEINCHGGITAIKGVLELVLKKGARLAEPGEFTKRAFLNGRIDLSQAEAVIDLIRAKTDESMKLAIEQSKGKLSNKVRNILDRLLNITAHIEAVIDFPEEGVEDVVISKIKKEAEDCIFDIEDMVKNAETGRILREGLNTIIAGKPNVGKSSLLNALIEEKRAIVTDVPGTTRDVIEEYINIGGIPLKLVDTAGIRETFDLVESIGVERSKEYIDKADLVIFMINANLPLDDEDLKIIELIKGKNVIIVGNKTDLGIESKVDEVKKYLSGSPLLYVSLKGENGIEDIKNEIISMVLKDKITVKDIYITNVRHKKILMEAAESIKSALNTIESGFPLDMSSIEFKDAYIKLGEITGDTILEDVVDRIFNNFCVGK